MMYDVPLLLRWAVDAKVIDSGVGQGLLRSSQLLNLGISTVYVLLLFFFLSIYYVAWTKMVPIFV